MSNDMGKAVGEKFQAWANSLPDNEQETLAQWMQKVSPPEVGGFSARWWEGNNAWSEAWWSAWQE